MVWCLIGNWKRKNAIPKKSQLLTIKRKVKSIKLAHFLKKFNIDFLAPFLPSIFSSCPCTFKRFGRETTLTVCVGEEEGESNFLDSAYRFRMECPS